MQHELASPEPPHSPAVRQWVEASLDGTAIEPALLAWARDPGRAEARARAERELRELDWPNHGRYETDNAAIVASGLRPDLVFMGDSLTEVWPLADADLFSPGRVCRGIAGQTSPQMLLRFQPDVVALRPRAVHLLAGLNDIAGNTGPTTPYRCLCNLRAMVELARANGIQVLLGLLPAVTAIPWRPGFDPAPWAAEINAALRTLAAERALTLIDYPTALAAASIRTALTLTHDGVHPNRRGYAAMRGALEPALAALTDTAPARTTP